MIEYVYKHRVPYYETDKMGYIHHSNYARICETARWEALRSLGIVYSDMEKANVWMPVYKFESTFKVPAFYDDLLEVKVIVDELPKVTWTIKYEIFREQVLINECSVVLAFFDPQKQKPCRPPKMLTNCLKPYFEGE